MKKCFGLFLLNFLFMPPLSSAEGVPPIRLQSLKDRQETSRILKQRSHHLRTESWTKAARRGWAIQGQGKGGFYVLARMVDNRPQYFITDNSNASISTAADAVRGTLPFNLDGFGLKVGVWDLISLPTHQEFGGRVTLFDSPILTHDHASHVIGTIAASGVNPLAEGMAPALLVDNYDFLDDDSEMVSRAATYAGESGKIYLSNHSYGVALGWQTGGFSGTVGPHWMGDYPDREDHHYGRYSDLSATFDSICYAAPYYLPFKSAGNARDQVAPSAGTTFYYYSADYILGEMGSWISKTYNPATDPYDDGWDDGGFDTVGPIGVAKNLITVGAVGDAVSGGERSLANATMSSFSGWGPVDDGRIKPDIVANGVDVLSCLSSGTAHYGNKSGTSMACPNAMGSAALLVDYYGRLFPGQAMRSSTLKGLILHTADDLGNTGPDYTFGWGLVNTERAAETIRNHYIASPPSDVLVEGTLNLANASDTYLFKWDEFHKIRATLCWTDPAGTPLLSGLDDLTPSLVNDLDLRITGPGGTTVHFPFLLSPATPAVAATTGDNSVDTVEQVLIANPTVPGTYTLVVSHKGTLTNDSQVYSLILTGQSGPFRSTVDSPSSPQSDLTLSGQNTTESSKMTVLRFVVSDHSGDGLPTLIDRLSIDISGTAGQAANDLAWCELVREGSGRVDLASSITNTTLRFGSSPNSDGAAQLDSIPEAATAEYCVNLYLSSNLLGAQGSTYAFGLDETNVDEDLGGTTSWMAGNTMSVLPVVGTLLVPEISIVVTPDTWVIGPCTLNSSVMSGVHTATNVGNVPTDFDILCQDAVNGWTVGSTTGEDRFAINVDLGANGTDDLLLSTTYQTLSSNVPAMGTESVKFKYHVPSGDSFGGGTAQDFTITLRASMHVP